MFQTDKLVTHVGLSHRDR